MPFYYDTIYWIVLIPVLILSVYAQIKVSSTFNRYGKAANRRRITGAQAAYEVLRSNGVTGVDIRPCSGSLTDHYDPRSNTIYLSQPVYNAATVSAVGVAAHEAGHAVQYAQAYGPIQVRSAIIPVTQFGSKFAFIALMLGLVLYSQPVFALGIALFGLTALFQLVTIRVYFTPSPRARRPISGAPPRAVVARRGAKRVLTAAALTYVAALLMSLVQLLRYLLIFASRGGNRRD